MVLVLKTLKILALQGGTSHSIHISSTELAKKLEISQQSASRHIINLEKKDLSKIVTIIYQFFKKMCSECHVH